jgi:hypothetical protein
MADTLLDQIRNFVESGGKRVVSISGQKLTSTQELNLFRVGKPARFTEAVDKGGRIAKYIESKMNVIDLIPCDFSIPLTKALGNIDPNNKSGLLDALRPNITYPEAINKFRRICENYGLPDRHGGLRLFLTDDTTATDEFASTYSENMIGSAINKFASVTSQINAFGRSVSSKYEDWMGNLTDQVSTILGGVTTEALEKTNASQELKDIAAIAGATAKAATSVITQGSRISLPKAWSDSTYSPNFNAVVKLVSPYGHPDAIKEFIIKPLMFLLILTGARTKDGISYGQSPKVSVKAYGITYLPLAAISGVSLRKGGADTTFNIYRQPLTIDVSITFQSLLSGFAIHENAAADPMNKDVFTRSSAVNESLQLPTAAGNTFFSTLGSVVESIKPVAITDISREYMKTSGLPSVPSNVEKKRASLSQKTTQSATVNNLDALVAAGNVWSRPPIQGTINDVEQQISNSTVAQAKDNAVEQFGNAVEQGKSMVADINDGFKDAQQNARSIYDDILIS